MNSNEDAFLNPHHKNAASALELRIKLNYSSNSNSNKKKSALHVIHLSHGHTQKPTQTHM